MICANLRAGDEESLFLKQQHKFCLFFHVTLNVIDLLKFDYIRKFVDVNFFLNQYKNTQILRKNAFFLFCFNLTTF